MEEIFAIPVEEGVLCSHFGHCPLFDVVKVIEGKIIDKVSLTPPVHEPGLLPVWLAEHGVTEVIAGGIGKHAVTLLEEKSIKVNIGAEKKTSEELVADRLNNALSVGENDCNH